MSSVQHAEARKLLQFISSAVANHKLLTYGTAAKALGSDSQKNSRMVAQVCDLLDAAAAFAGVPLLALVMVRELSGHINRKAWTRSEAELKHRDRVIDRSLFHKFTDADFEDISKALEKLEALGGKSNIAAWGIVRETFPDDVLYRRVTEHDSAKNLDAIDDIGPDTPGVVNTSGVAYARDQKIREAVKYRASGKCEFCGETGFKCSNGTLYLECHHIIALANDGADRMTNVIALCPKHHSEAHFGERHVELEKEMIRKVMILQGEATII